MRHTVIGLFNTYADAEAARDTLVQTGFARDTIELQANAEPSVGSATEEVAGSGVLANIERFLSSLFASGPRAPETAPRSVPRIPATARPRPEVWTVAMVCSAPRSRCHTGPRCAWLPLRHCGPRCSRADTDVRGTVVTWKDGGRVALDYCW